MLSPENIIQAAFHEIHRSGFRSASLDAILTHAGVTKGALYHHFPNKTALGYAVVDEVICKILLQRWLEPVEAADDPIAALEEILVGMGFEEMALACQAGCPLNNLAQEMSPVDEGFRRRLHSIYQRWQDGLAEALRRGQRNRLVRADIDPGKTALFFVASFEGGVGMAKNAKDPKVLEATRDSMLRYLGTLKVSQEGP